MRPHQQSTPNSSRDGAKLNGPNAASSELRSSPGRALEPVTQPLYSLAPTPNVNADKYDQRQHTSNSYANGRDRSPTQSGLPNVRDHSPTSPSGSTFSKHHSRRMSIDGQPRQSPSIYSGRALEPHSTKYSLTPSPHTPSNMANNGTSKPGPAGETKRKYELWTPPSLSQQSTSPPRSKRVEVCAPLSRASDAAAKTERSRSSTSPSTSPTSPSPRR